MQSREEIKEQIKEAADIVQIIGEHVDLKKSGARHLGLCPFHGEKTPSFSVNGVNQFYHCFGCGESGDVFSFLMKFHNIDFPTALKQLAERYNIALPEPKETEAQKKRQRLRNAIFDVNEKALLSYVSMLKTSPDAQLARQYLQNRNIPPDIQELFQIGYAPSEKTSGWDFLGKQFRREEAGAAIEAGLLVKKERGGCYDRFRDRIMFPIYNIGGQVCGFGGRIVGDGQPKYMNSPESPVYNKSSSLLGLFQQKEAIRKKNQVILVEGNFDLISLVAHGCDNVVAPLGTSLTREQVRLLKRFAEEAVLLFDGDTAGKKAAMRAVPFFFSEQMRGKVAVLPQGHDPDTFVQEKGIKALEQLIEEGTELSEFVLQCLVEKYGVSLEGKTRIAEELVPLVNAAASSLQRSVIISHFAEKLQMNSEELTGLLKQRGNNGTGGQSPVTSYGVKEKQKQQRATHSTPLTSSQKKLVHYLVFHPAEIYQLEEAGLRETLLGSVGEIVLLHVKESVQANSELQPEDILTRLDEGEERKVVADALLERQNMSQDYDEMSERDDCYRFLKEISLKKKAKNIIGEIEKAQMSGDHEKLQDLLLKKQKIDTETIELRMSV